MTRARARNLVFPVSFIAALACALPSRGYAQSGGAVSGTVTEPDGQPLSGVVVAVQGLGLSVATNATGRRSEEHTSELQSQSNLVCRLLLEKKKNTPVLGNHTL